MAQNINETTFAELKGNGTPMVIDFWATWCGPCRRVGPIIEQLAQQYAGQVNIVKCDVEEGEEVAAQFGITSVPTIVFLDGAGQQVSRLVGAQPKPRIEQEIAKLLQ